MPFTDEDLKRVKDNLSLYGVNPGIDICNYFDEVYEIAGLVERLEAAERCVELCATDENCCNIPELGENDVSPYYLWRKAAGK